MLSGDVPYKQLSGLNMKNLHNVEINPLLCIFILASECSIQTAGTSKGKTRKNTMTSK